MTKSVVFLNPLSMRAMVDISFGEDGAVAKYKYYGVVHTVAVGRECWAITCGLLGESRCACAPKREKCKG